MARHPGQIEADVARYREMSRAAGRGEGQVVVMSGLPIDDPGQAGEVLEAYRELGVDQLVCGVTYDTLEAYRAGLEALAAIAL